MNLELIIIQHKYLFYFIFLLLALIEGPIICFTVGYFSNIYEINIFAIYIIAFLGDFLGDIIHYFVGMYFNKVKFIHNRIKKIKIEHDKKLFKNMLILKLTPPLTSAGLLHIGYKKTNFKTFVLNAMILSIIFSFSFVSLGKFSGIGVSVFDSIYSGYILLLIKIIILIISILIIYFFISKLNKFIK